jgi:hypothetical protein
MGHDSISWTQRLRERLPDLFGEKAAALKGEGNYYHDLEKRRFNFKCGIGFHGDTEVNGDRLVIAARVGASMPLHFQWFHRFKPVGASIAIPLHDADIYAMSEKAVAY